MIRIVFLSALLLALLPIKAAATEDWTQFALISGKPSKVALSRPIDCPAEEICLGAYYKVKLSRIEVLRGQLENKRLTLELTALDPLYLKEPKKIVVLVRKQGDNITPLTWTTPEPFACFSSDLIAGTEMESAFYMTDQKTAYVDSPAARRVCTNAEWY